MGGKVTTTPERLANLLRPRERQHQIAVSQNSEFHESRSHKQIGIAPIGLAIDGPGRQIEFQVIGGDNPVLRNEEAADRWCQRIPNPSLYLQVVRVLGEIAANFAELLIPSPFICTFERQCSWRNNKEMHI